MEDYKKKYEEAMLRMNKWVEGSEIIEPKEVAEFVFPELKESEDERIRKGIIRNLEYLMDRAEGFVKEELQRRIAWLEEQGTPAKLSEEEQNRFAKGVLTSCALSFIDYLDAHKYEGKMCVSNGECEDIENAFHNDMWDRLHRYYCKYIVKQGEQKPIEWDADDLLKRNQIITILKEYNRTDLIAWLEKIEIIWLKSLKDRVQPKPKQELSWSEEDEEMFDAIIADIQFTQKAHTHEVNQVVYEREIDWLKSIKDRVQPQPKQEWSEEDEQMINDIIEVIDEEYVFDYQKIVTWLKSLKERYAWKPSDEQIKLLREVQQALLGKDCHNRFVNFMYELKRLREE